MSAKPPTTTERRDDEASSADDRHDTAELPVTMGTMRRAFRINEIWTFLVACCVAIAAVLGAYRYVIGEAEAAGRKGSEDVEKRVTALEKELPEVRKDIKGVYLFLLTKQRQERLERQDGGP